MLVGVPSPREVPVRTCEQVTLLFLESVGTTELLLILVVALIVFGPRKLPELSRSLGKGLGEFKRASDEFKRTWEREVSVESYERERKIGEAMLPPEAARAGATPAGDMLASHVEPGATTAGAQTVARGGDAWSNAQPVESASSAPADEPAPQSPHKSDWL